VSRSTASSVSCGSSWRISSTSDCTCCSATIMSVEASKYASTSDAPLNVRDRTRRMPGVDIAACSSGRVTLSVMPRVGSVPLCAMMTMRGNSSGG
jgi:hypothetical protein